jgi:hypothetical protein
MTERFKPLAGDAVFQSLDVYFARRFSIYCLDRFIGLSWKGGTVLPRGEGNPSR